MFQYPYGDSQQLNLDWLMEQWQETKASIDGSLQGEIDRVEAAITDLLTARDEAVAAQTAAETAATSASGYAGTASGAASTATAQAAAAAASAALAGTHASNAQTSETNAALQATAAGNSASSAATSATNARNSELAAAASSSAAAGNALYSEGFAVGEQNGTPVSSGSPYYENNAKYYDGESAAKALISEGFAVGEQNGTPVTSGSPYYENNAKYYADEAATVAASIPADYTQLSADVDKLKEDVELNPIILYQEDETVTEIKTIDVEILEGTQYYVSADSITTEADATETLMVITYEDNTVLNRYLPVGNNAKRGNIAPKKITKILFYSGYNYSSSAGKTAEYTNLTIATYSNIKKELLFNNNIIATTQTEMYAPSTMYPNSLVIVDNVLYKATTTITYGARLIPNTNVVQTTIADLISSLL